MKNSIIIFFLMPSIVFAQRSKEIDLEILNFYNRLEINNGFLYLDTVYYDEQDSIIRKRLGDSEFYRHQNLIEMLDMKRMHVNFASIILSLGIRATSNTGFGDLLDSVFLLPHNMDTYSTKFDSVIRSINSKHNEIKFSDSNLEHYLFESSYWEAIRQKSNRSQKKLLQILAAYISDKYFLFLYRITSYAGHAVYQYKAELIIR